MLLPVMVTDMSLPGLPMVDMLLPAMVTDISLPGTLMVDTLLLAMDTDISLPGPPMVDMHLPAMGTDQAMDTKVGLHMDIKCFRRILNASSLSPLWDYTVILSFNKPMKPLTPDVNPPPYISPLTVNTPVALCT